jgi:hypothetical protein
MKKINTLLACFIAITLVLSCSKSTTVKSSLIGKWAQVQTAYDNNGNGKIDSGEVATLNSIDIVIFKPRDTLLYIYSVSSKIDTTIYTYHVDGKKLLLTLDGKQYSMYIDSVSSRYMILRDTVPYNGMVTWAMYTKQ